MADPVLLTVDTSTQAGSVAVSRGETVMGEILLNVRSNHTDRLLMSVRQLLSDTGLELSEVDGFGVVLGPGSFTGVRIGVATVKGLAMSTGRPVVGVSSLRTLAMQLSFPRHRVCALLDARKKEVYAGLYQWEGGRPVCVGPEVVLPPERLLESLDGEVLFIGDGAVAYQTLITRRMGGRAHFAPWTMNTPRSSFAAALALDEIREGKAVPLELLVPCYIRPSEAEIMWAKREAEGMIEG